MTIGEWRPVDLSGDPHVTDGPEPGGRRVADAEAEAVDLLESMGESAPSAYDGTMISAVFVLSINGLPVGAYPIFLDAEDYVRASYGARLEYYRDLHWRVDGRPDIEVVRVRLCPPGEILGRRTEPRHKSGATRATVCREDE